ncbi:acyltransferase family protein [Bacteroidota bacterium]
MKNLDLNTSSNKERLYYIDWLRVLAFGLLFIFHAARFFDIYPWHIKNAVHSEMINVLVGFTHGWRMHLIFFISGVGTFFALRSRNGRFIKDRFKRLIAPFVFGIILLIPPQKFYEAISNGWFDGSLLDFVINYPSWLLIHHPGISLSWTGHLGYHIWYLAFLFIMTIAALPLLKAFTKENLVTKLLSAISNIRLGIFLFVVPIILFDIVLRPFFPGYLDWADFFVYAMYFLTGYIFMTQRRFVESARKYTYYFLNIGILTTALSAYAMSIYPELLESSSPTVFILSSIISSLNAFSWVMFLFGLSQRKLNFNHRLLNSLNVGILPFYILHQTVIILIGYYVIALDLSILSKFSIILSTSLVATIGLYQIIRRFTLLRVLFGMKTR